MEKGVILDRSKALEPGDPDTLGFQAASGGRGGWEAQSGCGWQRHPQAVRPRGQQAECFPAKSSWQP